MRNSYETHTVVMEKLPIEKRIEVIKHMITDQHANASDISSEESSESSDSESENSETERLVSG